MSRRPSADGLRVFSRSPGRAYTAAAHQQSRPIFGSAFAPARMALPFGASWSRAPQRNAGKLSKTAAREAEQHASVGRVGDDTPEPLAW